MQGDFVLFYDVLCWCSEHETAQATKSYQSEDGVKASLDKIRGRNNHGKQRRRKRGLVRNAETDKQTFSPRAWSLKGCVARHKSYERGFVLGPIPNVEAGQIQPPPQKRVNEAFRLRLHEVKLVRRILVKVKAAMDSNTTSLATDETIKMNLHHLIEHSCPSKYIRSLKMIELVKNLTLYPNTHITKLAHYLLKRPEWGGKASDRSYRLIKPTSLNMMQNTDVVMVGDGVQDEAVAPHGHSEQGSFDGSEYNEMKGNDDECAEGSCGVVQERAGGTGGGDVLQNENCNDGDSESRHDGPTKKESPSIQPPQQEGKREGEGARDDYQDFDSLMLESDCSSMESSVGYQGGSGGTS